MKRFAAGIILVAVVLGMAAPAMAQPGPAPIPTMAYYYIWFTASSWDRAKTDYPLLGRYSSDDRSILEEHVRLAKEAGLDGFIVSWKSTYALDQRLQELADIAANAHFALWVMYQGLDFERQPLPVDRIVNDLQYFANEFAGHPAFAMYDRPVVILSGTWEFSAEEIALVANDFRDSLHLLGSERSVDGYERIAKDLDGNAYYWSSVDPATFPGYQAKLDAMGDAVHAHGGLWVAPAAPGFDARLIGGTRVVERRDGQTLQLEMNAALRSNPDAIGIISWNEFSENTHIEPSQNYGTRALDTLSGQRTSLTPRIAAFDSSDPGDTDPGNHYQPLILLGTFVFAAVSLSAVLLRRR